MGRADAGTEELEEEETETDAEAGGAATPVLLEFTIAWHSWSASSKEGMRLARIERSSWDLDATLAVLLDKKSNSGAAGHAAVLRKHTTRQGKMRHSATK